MVVTIELVVVGGDMGTVGLLVMVVVVPRGNGGIFSSSTIGTEFIGAGVMGGRDMSCK